MAAQKKNTIVYTKYKNTFTKQNIKTDYKLKLQYRKLKMIHQGPAPDRGRSLMSAIVLCVLLLRWADPENDTISRSEHPDAVGGVRARTQRQTVLRRLYGSSRLLRASRNSHGQPGHVALRRRHHLRQTIDHARSYTKSAGFDPSSKGWVNLVVCGRLETKTLRQQDQSWRRAIVSIFSDP